MQIASQPSLGPEIECISIPFPSGPQRRRQRYCKPPWLGVEYVVPRRPCLYMGLLYCDPLAEYFVEVVGREQGGRE